MAFAGAAPEEQTIRVGIQSIFADRVLTAVIHDCTEAHGAGPGSSSSATARLTSPSGWASGYVDLVFAVAPRDLKLNVLSEWTEKYVWGQRAPNSWWTGMLPWPLIVPGRKDFLDRLAIDAMDQKGDALSDRIQRGRHDRPNGRGYGWCRYHGRP